MSGWPGGERERTRSRAEVLWGMGVIRARLGGADFGEDFVDVGGFRAVAELPAAHLAPVGDSLAPSFGGLVLLAIAVALFDQVVNA
jgi:hypothetical protein